MAKLDKHPTEYSLNDDNFRVETVNYIKDIGGKWEIGVFDRGKEYDVRKYATEEEACYAFLEDFYPEVLNAKACIGASRDNSGRKAFRTGKGVCRMITSCPTEKERATYAEYCEKWCTYDGLKRIVLDDAPQEVKIFFKAYAEKYLKTV